jgi:hypothetical protein
MFPNYDPQIPATISLFEIATGALVDLAPLRTSGSSPLPYKDYRFAGRWIAYTHPRVEGGPVQAWTRSPDGVKTVYSALNEVVELAGLSPTGAVVFDASGKRYLSSPAAPSPELVSTTQGKVVRKDRQYDIHVVLADTLFRIGPPAQTDGGAPPDSSSGEAGTPEDAPLATDAAIPPDAEAVDAPAVDAAEVDAATAVDAVTMVDAGAVDASAVADGARVDSRATDGASPSPPDGSGCACTQAGGRTGTPILWLVMVMLIRARRWRLLVVEGGGGLGRGGSRPRGGGSPHISSQTLGD